MRPGGSARPSASTWNAFCDAAEAHRARAFEQGLIEGRRTPPGFLRMKNNIGSDLGRFTPVGIGSFALDPSDDEDSFKNDPVVNAHNVTPNIWTFGITQSNISDGATDDVLVSGVTVCQVEVLSTAHRYAYMSGNFPLRSYWWGGAKILQIEPGTGTKWAVVQLGHGECPAYNALYIGPHYAIHVPPANLSSPAGTDTGFTMPYDGISGSELFPDEGNVTPSANDPCVIVWARSLASGGGGLGGNPMALFQVDRT
jgi:hypothetical protein